MPTKERDDQLFLMVGDIRGKMDLLLKASEQQGTRLADLENWKNRVIGIVIATSALAGGLASKFAGMLTGISAHP